jgi:hypothetical protein
MLEMKQQRVAIPGSCKLCRPSAAFQRLPGTELTVMPGIACGASRADTMLTRAILRNYHGRRPGDRYVIF